MGSAEEAAATSAPTARMRGSSRRGPLLTLPPEMQECSVRCLGSS